MSGKQLGREAVRVLVSLFFVGLAFVLLKDKWGESFAILKQTNWNLFSSVFGIFLFINVIASFRLKHVLLMQKINVAFSRVVFFNLIGLFFNLFLPSQLGGDAVKAYYLSKDSGTKMRTISAILVDRIFGLAALITVAVVTIPFFKQSFSDPRLVNSVLMVAFVFLIGLIIFFLEPVAERLKFLRHLIPTSIAKQKMGQFYETLTDCKKYVSAMILCYGLSIGIQLMMILIAFIIGRSIGLHISYMVFMLILPVTAIIAMIPSLGGLGVREASVIYFLSKYTTVQGATAFALAFDILIYGIGLLCGILYLFFGGRLHLKEIATIPGP
ncbi:MAG: hypothetical protein COV74_01490 [Candidatus Omnitrophica bacterium CG11_big_fil_rev_8_21_14_0_20_45_26]|uniref:TIGR00374 family protein n=1 Tax=Candidatus Abzuiibacterium crystallinum TaxID=1974748 RepID=A0A2H0LS39_9BACT|nr:MAG: hypothetical protein COV74_01490 [Candidatus Omnitrophica bacterium CG11_big_fil_rev_8_21_14_0_20_45_26]PIW64971.1 MAG: hypothetical protein COW12_03770 [Candidatus Omnitrophica bacterium CG12_big_fil_rev_8_21_14_0_65_45_16]